MSPEKIFLTNPIALQETNLRSVCPRSFQTDKNPWTAFVPALYFSFNSSNWSWRAKCANIQKEQLSFFQNILFECDVSPNIREPIAGWLLSIMLEEIPEH